MTSNLLGGRVHYCVIVKEDLFYNCSFDEQGPMVRSQLLGASNGRSYDAVARQWYFSTCHLAIVTECSGCSVQVLYPGNESPHSSGYLLFTVREEPVSLS
jgi:hypothetical protein